MYKLFYNSTNQSLRKTETALKKNYLNYEKRHNKTAPLTWAEFLHMLSLTEDGVDDILSTRSTAVKSYGEEKIRDLTIKEFYNFYLNSSGVLKSPIVLGNRKLIVGYSEETENALTPRKLRQKEMSLLLDIDRKVNTFTPENEEDDVV